MPGLVQVVEYFAERADMILLLFDAHKLDISDEFKRTIEVRGLQRDLRELWLGIVTASVSRRGQALKGHDDKIRVVLNKADKVSGQQLMRVYVPSSVVAAVCIAVSCDRI